MTEQEEFEFRLRFEREQAQATQEKPAVPPMSASERFGMGLIDQVQGGAQLLTKLLPDSVVNAGNVANNWLAEKTGLVARLPEGGVDQQTREREAAYNAARGPDAGVDWVRFAGNIASPVNLAMGAGAARAATLPMRLASSGAAGGAAAAMAPVTGGDFATEKAKQVATGAAFGAAVPAVTSLVGRSVSPKASVNPDVALLRAEGVRPTVGQSLGGWANKTEEKLASLPIMGDAISASRRRAVEQLNNAAINRAVEPIGVKVKGFGQEAVKEAGDAISAAYEAGKARLGTFQLDQQAARELSTLRSMTRTLPAKERKSFDSLFSYLKNEVSPNGHIVPDGFKRFDSKVGAETARFSGSNDAYQKQVGDAMKELQRIVLDAAKRANPEAAAALKKADEAWANLVRVEGAATRAHNAEGVFTPGQLGMAVRGADRSVRDRATARGDALMQDLSRAGQSVLGNRYPDSGTPGRIAMGLGGLGAGWLDPTIPASLVGGALAYTPPAQALLRGLVASRPAGAKTVASLLNKSSPMLAPAGGLLGVEVFD